MAQSSFKANLGGFDQVDKAACYTSGGIFFFLFCSNMSMAKGDSHKQELFELQIFSLVVADELLLIKHKKCLVKRDKIIIMHPLFFCALKDSCPVLHFDE